MADPDIITVDAAGDVVLHFKDSQAQVDQQFRCSRKVLGKKSRYFEVLFDLNKFSEGKEVESKLNTLLKDFQDVVSVPSIWLPKVTIKDIGDISATEGLRLDVLHTFLKILHGETLTKKEKALNRKEKWNSSIQEALTRAALLATLTEHFTATEMVRHHIETKGKHILGDFYAKNKWNPNFTEANHRQKLLVGMVLFNSEFVQVSSAKLICEGSKHWVDDAVIKNGSLWDRLPRGIEEELQCRREYVLETLSSLPNHFVSLYSSKQQQCKLGYDTSPQCDSFQLGEMIRFFTRRGLLRLQSTFGPDQEQTVCMDDVPTIIEKMRHCPSYQLDANHQHCGLRTRILPLLEVLLQHLDFGICLNCWNNDPSKESWLNNPTGGTWYVSDIKVPRWKGKYPESFCANHQQVKAMYTAEEREWTSSRP